MVLTIGWPLKVDFYHLSFRDGMIALYIMFLRERSCVEVFKKVAICLAFRILSDKNKKKVVRTGV